MILQENALSLIKQNYELENKIHNNEKEIEKKGNTNNVAI
jgi:hypothetical protein